MLDIQWRKQWVKIALKEISQKIYLDYNPKEDYHILRALLRDKLIELLPTNFSEKFYEAQNNLLLAESNDRKIVNIDDLSFTNNITIFKGDITTIAADAIVNAANNRMLGSFDPMDKSVDQIIHQSAGFQLRNEMNNIMKNQKYYEPAGRVKVSNGYNLPAKYIFHTVGPWVLNEPTETDKQTLISCYKNCLDEAKKMDLKSIAFCCISTGAYEYPVEQASTIATDTVYQWQNENDSDLKIIFCTYSTDNYASYAHLLHSQHNNMPDHLMPQKKRKYTKSR